MSTISAGTTLTTGLVQTSDTTGVLNINTGASNTTAITVDASQNVGIGTSSPVSFGGGYKTLEVKGSTSTNGGVVRASTSDNSYMIDMYANNAGGNLESRGANPMLFLTNATERMRIDSSGNVGIGTSSPPVKLSLLSGNATANTAVTLLSLSSDRGDRYSAISCVRENDSEKIGIGFLTSAVGVAPTERMRIDSSGNLLVGTTSAVGANKLTVNGSTASTGYNCRSGSGGSYVGNFFNINWTGSPQLWIDFTNLGTIQLASDYRIKRNVETQIAPALERVMALRPVTYQMADYKDGLFKASDDIKEGFIAHEVQEVIPSGAEGVKDAENQIQSLRVDAILAVAVKAIQELKAELDTVKTELSTLKGAA